MCVIYRYTCVNMYIYMQRERTSVYIHIYTNPLKLKQGTRSTQGCIQIPSGQNKAQRQHRVAYKSPLAKTATLC